MVENPFNIEMAEEDDDEDEEDDDFEKEIIKTGKIKAKPSDLEEDTDTSEDEIEFSKDGISDLEDLALHEEAGDSISNSGEFPSAEQTSFYLDRGGRSRLQTTGAKKITAPIKPIAPRKLSIDVDKDGNAVFTVGSDESDNSSSTEEPMVPTEVAKPETAAGVFLKGAKKKAKRKEKHGSEEDTHDESDAEDEDQNAVSQQESREPKEFLEKIFALSRYRAKKESEATSNNIYQVVSENVKLDKEMKKGKTDLAKFDKNGIPITPEQSEQVTNTLNMVSLDGSSIKITHPFYEMMIETIKKNGSLAIPEIIKTKTKEPKEIFKQCKKCEAKLAKEWKICPICGSKQ